MSAAVRRLYFNNATDRTMTLGVCQGDPEGAVAWYARRLEPNGDAMVEWALEYSLVWAETGPLTTGVPILPGQHAPADLSTGGGVVLTTLEDGRLTFDPQHTISSPPGTLTIEADSSIAPNRASVGINMTILRGYGAPGPGIAWNQAMPNMRFVFQPRPSYFFVFGNFEPFSLLGADTMRDAVPIVFPPNVTSMSAKLLPGNKPVVNQTLSATQAPA